MARNGETEEGNEEWKMKNGTGMIRMKQENEGKGIQKNERKEGIEKKKEKAKYEEQNVRMKRGSRGRRGKDVSTKRKGKEINENEGESKKREEEKQTYLFLPDRRRKRSCNYLNVPSPRRPSKPSRYQDQPKTSRIFRPG